MWKQEKKNQENDYQKRKISDVATKPTTFEQTPVEPENWFRKKKFQVHLHETSKTNTWKPIKIS